MYIIYKITNASNGKVYIGQTARTLQSRWRSHLACARNGSNKYLHTAIRKHGESAFHVEEMETVEYSIANSREQHFIALYKATDKTLGYNRTSGGDHFKMTPEWCAKVSARMKGNKHFLGKKLSAEHKQAFLAGRARQPGSFLGKKFTDEHRRNLSTSLKAITRADEDMEHIRQVGLNNRGRKHSAEAKLRMGASHSGSKRSDETKRRMSEARAAWWGRKKNSILN